MLKHPVSCSVSLAVLCPRISAVPTSLCEGNTTGLEGRLLSVTPLAAHPSPPSPRLEVFWGFLCPSCAALQYQRAAGLLDACWEGSTVSSGSPRNFALLVGVTAWCSSVVGATSLTRTTRLVLTALIKFPEFSGLGSTWLVTQPSAPLRRRWHQATKCTQCWVLCHLPTGLGRKGDSAYFCLHHAVGLLGPLLLHPAWCHRGAGGPQNCSPSLCDVSLWFHW